MKLEVEGNLHRIINRIITGEINLYPLFCDAVNKLVEVLIKPKKLYRLSTAVIVEYIRQYAYMFLKYETGNITDFCKKFLDKGIYLKLWKYYLVILTTYDGVLDGETIQHEKANIIKAKTFQIKQQKRKMIIRTIRIDVQI